MSVLFAVGAYNLRVLFIVCGYSVSDPLKVGRYYLTVFFHRIVVVFERSNRDVGPPHLSLDRAFAVAVESRLSDKMGPVVRTAAVALSSLTHKPSIVFALVKVERVTSFCLCSDFVHDCVVPNWRVSWVVLAGPGGRREVGRCQQMCL